MPKRSTLVLALSLAIATTSSHAENWPARPVKAIVPFPPGSLADVVPRVVFEQLSTQIGQPIIVENRGGAGGTIAAQQVAISQPNGYTLLINSSAHTIAPALYAKLNYQPARDFAAVIPFGVTPNVLVVPAQRNFRTAGELVAAAKSHPGKLTYGSAGVGSATHLSAERFLATTAAQALHIPFKGGPEIVTALLAGHIDFFFGPIGIVRPHVLSGKLNALAVNTTKRSALLPDVPTLGEAGVANAEYPFWIGLLAPAGTPRESSTSYTARRSSRFKCLPCGTSLRRLVWIPCR
ncbi:MAG: Bug family tripartite tricarboxylate transporter substrate binding protein [Hyphomicrobiaceae bacterium]